MSTKTSTSGGLDARGTVWAVSPFMNMFDFSTQVRCSPFALLFLIHFVWPSHICPLPPFSCLFLLTTCSISSQTASSPQRCCRAMTIAMTTPLCLRVALGTCLHLTCSNDTPAPPHLPTTACTDWLWSCCLSRPHPRLRVHTPDCTASNAPQSHPAPLATHVSLADHQRVPSSLRQGCGVVKLIH